VVIDGLGFAQLRKLLARGYGRSFFAERTPQVISTVFPATTATAVTTLSTGASPAEHGILGWFLNFPDLGILSVVLLAETRTKVSLAHDSFDLGRYLDIPSHLNSIPCRREIFVDPKLGASRFSRGVGHWHKLRPFQKLTDLIDFTHSFARAPRQAVAYAYWPRLDTLSHRYGCFSRQAREEFQAIDQVLAGCAGEIAGTNTLMLVLADHGLVDCPASKQIDVAAIDGFLDCLATLPAGDPRHLICYVRPSKVKKFLACVKRTLGDACACVPGSVLYRSGAFGPGPDHKALCARIGDFHLLAQPGYALPCSLPQLPKKRLRANHGGMTSEEIQVPLYVVEPE